MTRLGFLLSAIACTCFITTAFADEKAGDKRKDGFTERDTVKRDGVKREAGKRDGERKREGVQRKVDGNKANQADRLRDGKGPVDQRRGQGGQIEMIVRMLKAADKNNDGKISKEEAPDRMKQRFDRIDQNSDGFVDKEETAALIKRLREMMAKRGDQPVGNKREGDKMRQRDGEGIGKGDGKDFERKPRDRRADGRAKDAKAENVKPKRPDAE